MLEKRQEIGSPVRCGEGIARRWFDEVGIVLDRRWIAHEVEGAKIISPGGSTLHIDDRHAGDHVGTVIERDLFDKAVDRLADVGTAAAGGGGGAPPRPSGGGEPKAEKPPLECPKCHHQVPVSDRFCKVCGHQLRT